MKKVNGSIVRDNEEAFLFTYSEEEKQQNDINRANAELVFNSAYLTVPMELLRLGLSGNEVLILAFVNSWLCEHPNRFYFSNKRLSKMFNLTEVGVSKILKRLTNAGYIQMSYKRKADGGQIRFINVPTYTNFNYQLKQSISSNLNKVYGSNNNINNNNIREKENSQKIKKPDITREQVEELSKTLEISQEAVIRWYQRIKDYELSKGKKPYKDYPATIRNWVRRAKENQ